MNYLGAVLAVLGLLLSQDSVYALSCPSNDVDNILDRFAPKGQKSLSPTTSNPWGNPWDVPVNALVIKKSKQKPAQKYSKGEFASANSSVAQGLRNGVDYEPIELHASGPGPVGSVITLSGCTVATEPGSGLFLKRIDKDPVTGEAILIMGGLAPDGSNVTFSCTTGNGVVQPAPISTVHRVTTVFGSQIINPSTSSLTLKLIARPVQCEFGKTGNFYLAASYHGQFYFYSNSIKNWKAWHVGEPMAIWFTTTIQAFDTQTALANMNISAMPGVQFYMGYGLDESDMITYGKVKLVYPK